jgi:xanthine dehydrogenase YagS FAD-binding subunit
MMQPFMYERAITLEAATRAVSGRAGDVQFIAGGTTLVDLMRLDVMRPDRVIDINPLRGGFNQIEVTAQGLRLGAMVRMAEAAQHPHIVADYPVIVEALNLAASQQIRNMASLGGNLLQRTRCDYFREASFACNKREPGSGCAALDGINRQHAVLGTSDHCIAAYPGDLAQALIALDAVIEVTGPEGRRMLPLADLHRLPGDTPHLETNLRPGEIITLITVPAAVWTRRSRYLKIRDRDSYAFALASAAVAIDLDGETVRQARIALGGVAAKPWRAREAEAALTGQTLDEASATKAAELAFVNARPREHNGFKVALGKATLVRALLETRDMKV